jgi:hypothetical protein
MSIPDAGPGALSAGRRAYELLDFLGFAWDDPEAEMCRAAAIRHFKEHARDQRHLCAEALPVSGDNETDPHAAVKNAPEPGKHNG